MRPPSSDFHKFSLKIDPFLSKFADMRILPSKTPFSVIFGTLMRTLTTPSAGTGPFHWRTLTEDSSNFKYRKLFKSLLSMSLLSSKECMRISYWIILNQNIMVHSKSLGSLDILFCFFAMLKNRNSLSRWCYSPSTLLAL